MDKKVKKDNKQYTESKKRYKQSLSKRIESRYRRAYEEGYQNPWFKYFFQKGGTFDWQVAVIVLVLFFIGFAMVSSAQYAMLASDQMIRQAIFGVVGIILMFLISKIDYQILNSHWSLVGFGFILILNLYYAFQAKLSGNINRGGSFQPSEVLKFMLIACLAYLICALHRPLNSGGNTRVKRTPPAKANGQSAFERNILFRFDNTSSATFLLLAISGVATLSVLFQSHLSGAIIVFLLAMIALGCGGADRRWLIFVWAVVAVGVVLILIRPETITDLHLSGYMQDRVVLWLEKPVAKVDYETLVAAGKLTGESDRAQVEASLKAIGSGGWFGLGFGNSIYKYAYLAEAKTDFILAIVVEELGYIPTVGILGLFSLLIYRCMKIARSTIDKFGAMLVTCIAAQIAIEVILNICVVTDTMPNTGITFPFFSYGGSALIMLFVEIGIVLSVSRSSKVTLDSADKLMEE